MLSEALAALLVAGILTHAALDARSAGAISTRAARRLSRITSPARSLLAKRPAATRLKSPIPLSSRRRDIWAFCNGFRRRGRRSQAVQAIGIGEIRISKAITRPSGSPSRTRLVSGHVSNRKGDR